MNESGVINFRSTVLASEGFILTAINSYMISAALFSMVSFDLFTRLDLNGPMTRAELAASCGLAVDQLDKLVTVARAIGLMTCEGDRLMLSPSSARLLSRNSGVHQCDAIMHHKNHVYPLLARLDESLRDSAPALEHLGWPGARPEFFERAADTKGELAIAVGAMNTFSRGAGAHIASLIAAQRPLAAVLDLGGGGGQVAIDIAEAMPQARITLLDRAAVLEHARDVIVERHLDQRIALVSGDALSTLPFSEDAFDVVVIASVLGDYARREQDILLAGARRCLKTDGLLIVSETLLDDDYGGPILPALMSLYARVLTPGGQNFSAASIRELLSSNGFGDIQIYDNRASRCRDSISASKA